MPIQILIAHARGEESCAEELSVPLREAGFEVAHLGTVLVGDSVVADASRVLMGGGPVVLCGTIRALGTKWARQVVSAARYNHGSRVFCVQMDEEADVESVAFDEKIAEYWRDPAKAVADLIGALRAAFPADEEEARQVVEGTAEARYRRLALESCDIVDLANLPESERHIATRNLELRRLYVPLNVVVKTGDEPDALHDVLRILEEQRASARGWFSAGAASSETGAQQRVPLGERLAVARRLVVLGDPGAGKTTLLRWLATAYLLRLKRDPDLNQLPAVETLPDEDWLPVIVRCRDLSTECASGALDDVLGHTLRKAELSVDEAAALRRLLRVRLEQGRALLLIDGLDEIADPTLRARFAQQLEQIHIAFPDAPIVVTSRIVGYRDMGFRIGRGFEHVTVAEFEPGEKDDFARRWCALTELPERREAAAQELIADIHSTDRIERLTGNPMLLTTMALVKRKVGRLPTRRSDLYWEALQVLLNWRPEVDQPIAAREAVPQLEYVAYAMCDHAIQRIPEDELLELLDRVREEYPRLHDVRIRTSAAFLQALESRTGILIHTGYVRDRGRPVRVYEFRHLTFQEYLAGLALVDGVYPNRASAEKLAVAVSRIAAGMAEGVTGRGGEESAIGENWREAVRLAVANARHDEADGVLLATLPSAEVEVTRRTRSRSALAAFCLADEPKVSEEVALQVMSLLGQVVDRRDSNYASVTDVVDAALSLASSRWADDLRKALVQEYRRREPINRAPIGSLLGRISAPDFYDSEGLIGSSLVNMESPHDSDSFSLLFGAAINRSTRVGEDIPGQQPEYIELATQLLDRDAPSVQVALTYFSEISIADARTLDLMSHAIRRKWDDGGVKEAGLRVINRYGLADFYPEVVAELDSTYRVLRTEAVVALRSLYRATPIDSDKFFEPLSRLSGDEDELVRLLSIVFLKDVQDSRRVDLLVRALFDESFLVSDMAAYILGDIRDARATQAILRAMPEADVVPTAAIRALGMRGDASAANPLFPYLDSAEADLRIAALGAIARLLLDAPGTALLSRDLDGTEPYLDPREPITADRIALAEAKLRRPADEIRSRYRELAPELGLTLSF